MIALTCAIVVVVANSINMSLKNKDNTAQTVRGVTEVDLITKRDASSSNLEDEGKTYAEAEEGIEGTGIKQNICGDSRACNYDPKAQSSHPNSCVFAVYDIAFGSKDARTCKPSKSNEELEVIPGFAPNGGFGYPASGRTCSIDPSFVNVHIHKWSYDSYGNLASNTNYFLGSYNGSWRESTVNNKKRLAEDIKNWQGKSACKQMLEYESDMAKEQAKPLPIKTEASKTKTGQTIGR